ncbi:MAG: TonB-dependent receptor [Acidobacteriota bacterium]|nr:MAG: TonB-dependent receptor [Acidobacteriota bacterium]
MNRLTRNGLMALCVAVALAGIVLAQTFNATVSGTIKDQTGAVIAGAKVTLIDLSTLREMTATTNDQGFYLFNDVRPGRYRIVAEREGFTRVEVTDVQVNVATPATVNLELQPGQIAEVITTSASEAQAVVNTENATLQTTVLERQINDLPLNGRNPLSLAGLQAGVNTSGSNRTSSVNGTRGTFTNLTWDGININDNFIRTDSFFGTAAPSVVSVSEYTLTTQNGSPTDGLGVAQVKLVTPRGSTAYHGNLFEFHRNDAMDANSFFNNAADIEKEKLIQNQFGFGVGGPVKLPGKLFGPLGFNSNNLFFYGYYEGTRVRTDTSVLRTVLTQSARQGNFTYRRSDNGQLQTVNLANLGGLPFDPKTQSLIATTPLPNDLTNADITSDPALANTAGFRFNSPTGVDSDLWGFRIDYDANSRNRFEAIFSRFTFNFPNSGNEPFPGRPGDGQSSVRPRGSFAWNWTPTDTLNNELRFGFNNYNVNFFTNEPFADGYQLDFPIITDPVDNFLQQGRKADNYELINNANWVKGRHQIRFGGMYRRVYIEPFNFGATLPLYTLGFNATGNVNPLARGLFPGGISTNDFNRASSFLAILSGSIAEVDQSFFATSRTSGFVSGAPERQQFQYSAFSGYVGDTWRAHQRLTLNVGLRYEYITVPTEKNGLALMPKAPGIEALFDPNAVLDFAGSGTGRPFFDNDYDNFAPSISLAWDPFGDGRTSIRAGYSMSYVIDNNISTVLNAAVRGNDGLQADVALLNPSGTVSGGGIQPVPVPAFQVPRQIADNLAIDFGTALFTIQQNLQTPYVQQWTFGVERELFRDTVFEARYVGNRGVKLTRAIDINQVRIFDNGFLEDFQRAERNLAANGNPGVGEPLQVFPQLGLGGLLTNATILNLIAQGQVGELAALYVTNRDLFLTPGDFGSQLGAEYFLRTNPNAFVADYVGNGAFSNYHALQTEIRRRLRNGLYFQANYTYGKAFSDYEGSQTNFNALLDLGSTNAVEKQRIGDDITHVFKMNAIYELPFGPGKYLLDRSGVIGKIVGGWSFNPILRWQTGEPISIVSARGTLNRAGRSAKNSAISSLSASELQKRTGLFRDPQGRPLIFDPSLIGTDGRANTQLFQNPTSGALGTLQLTPVSGPSRFDFDASLIKRTALTERANLEFRIEAFNLFNRTNFDVGQTQNINSTTFGRITSTFSPRVLQVAARINF